MFGTILLILQIVGALPAVIDAFKKLWAMISEIKDGKTRRAYKVKTLQWVRKHTNQEEKTISDMEQCSNDLLNLTCEVETLLAEQREALNQKVSKEREETEKLLADARARTAAKAARAAALK